MSTDEKSSFLVGGVASFVFGLRVWRNSFALLLCVVCWRRTCMKFGNDVASQFFDLCVWCTMCVHTLRQCTCTQSFMRALQQSWMRKMGTVLSVCVLSERHTASERRQRFRQQTGASCCWAVCAVELCGLFSRSITGTTMILFEGFF